MIFAEVVVNVPIRRTFARHTRNAVEPQEDLFGGLPGESRDESLDAWSVTAPETLPETLPETNGSTEPPTLQTFHYHAPPDLEGILAPGHLVWVPFGPREVQGVVLALGSAAPVATKAVRRLARTEPVLTSVQLELAAWIADYYVAPISEAVKLFLPPGLLEKEDGTTSVRAKREHHITLLKSAQEATAALAQMGRATVQAEVFAYLLRQAGGSAAQAEVDAALKRKCAPQIHALAEKGLIAVEDEQVMLAHSPDAAYLDLLELRGTDKYLDTIRALAAAGGSLWKSELYAEAPGDLNMLRSLQDAGVIALDERVRFRDPLAGRTYAVTRAPFLTSEQAAVWKQVYETGLARREPAGEAAPKFLIHGVTGSGKTEIYLKAIGDVLERGKQALVLVPEIALTPQTVARFAGRFPGRVTVVHSQLNQGERYDVWRKIRDDEFDVVIGPRSALFTPLPRPGLIIIDEEHESSYKQDAEVWGSYKVFYDARAVARRLADLTGSTLILGSATPSLEAYHATEQGELTLLRMPRRVVGRAPIVEGGPPQPVGPLGEVADPYAELPPVEIVDMRQELRAGHRSIFSRSLQAELHTTLDAGEQAILFLNRRGSSTFVMCRDCGYVAACERCDTPLTFHERMNVLVCHRCNRRYPIPNVCPACNSKRIKYFGSGTQRVEELVQQLVPRARVLRWDADTTAGKGSHEAILERFARHEADVLIGTQMIAKGLDLPMVTLVGVVSADVSLFLPDFRAGERTFQLLTQVAGRAGRSSRRGRVVIQTYRPDHYVIQAAAQHDYAAFYEREMGHRREHRLPPLHRLARLIFWERNAQKAEAAANEMADALRRRSQELWPPGSGADVAARPDILGPAPAFFARFRGYYRQQILLRGGDPAALLRGMPIPFGWRVDIDPVSVL